MLLKIGLAWIATGIAFLAMAWLEPAGPLFMVLGTGLCAVALEQWLDAGASEAPEHSRSRGELRQDRAA